MKGSCHCTASQSVWFSHLRKSFCFSLHLFIFSIMFIPLFSRPCFCPSSSLPYPWPPPPILLCLPPVVCLCVWVTHSPTLDYAEQLRLMQKTKEKLEIALEKYQDCTYRSFPPIFTSSFFWLSLLYSFPICLSNAFTQTCILAIHYQLIDK